MSGRLARAKAREGTGMASDTSDLVLDDELTRTNVPSAVDALAVAKHAHVRLQRRLLRGQCRTTLDLVQLVGLQFDHAGGILR